PPRPLPPDVSPSTEPEPLDPPPLDPSPAAPPPREPTPEERLLEALRAELRCVRGPHEGALTDSHLASLVVGSGSGRQVAEETDRFFVIDLAHPLTRAARDRGAREPLLLSMLASAVYTYLNVRLAEIEDHDEAAFHGAHARHLLSGALGGRPPP
ncbi:MAG TPA: hypothetical protein PKW35_05485, partial [Nannocystaceae bacterium]|nr:hypothetical protein [Nannocystaceae bacterium]